MAGANKRPIRTPKKAAGAPSTSRASLRCPDCDFVARHPMGLGRHRSTRHGVVSQRQSRRDSAGGWLTRHEAARRAGVHYNTITQWERSGRLRRSKRGARGTLVSASDLARLVGGTGTAAGSLETARIKSLERRFDELLSGLERLVASARTRTVAAAAPRKVSRSTKPARAKR